jgi:acetyl esterase/lipase
LQLESIPFKCGGLFILKMMLRFFPLILIGIQVLLAVSCYAETKPKTIKGWPEGVKEIKYPSSADSTDQPALFYVPKTDKPVPLLVALHTWSGRYTQGVSIPYAKWCVENKWIFIHPHFRGPNRSPEACGSELVVGDILSAVEYAKNISSVDQNRIYLVGGSGGGYTALVMAGRAPHVWAGVSAWVPISDLKDWYNECRKLKCSHADDIVKSCGGEPGQSQAVDLEYKKRSPVTFLSNAVNVPLDINAGIKDGHHSGGVPINHSLRAFNQVAAEKDRICEEDIQYFVQKILVPEHLKKNITDQSYGNKVPLFRRTSGRARVTIFDGGHEMICEAALNWLSKQEKPNPETKEPEPSAGKIHQ